LSRNGKEKANIFAGHLEEAFIPNELPQNEAALEELLQVIQPINFYTYGNPKL
jgi:hypothetical protein